MLKIVRSTFIDADNVLTDADMTQLDKEDEWSWEDGESVRPNQSRKLVKEVIMEGREGKMDRFYQHFLKGFVVPDESEDGNTNQVNIYW